MMYADYLKERLGKLTYENEHGFIVYQWTDDGKGVYFEDIYIKPTSRRSQHGTNLANDVCEIARKCGKTYMVGTVVPSARNSTQSLQALLHFGMTLLRSHENIIWFYKDL